MKREVHPLVFFSFSQCPDDTRESNLVSFHLAPRRGVSGSGTLCILPYRGWGWRTNEKRRGKKNFTTKTKKLEHSEWKGKWDF